MKFHENSAIQIAVLALSLCLPFTAARAGNGTTINVSQTSEADGSTTYTINVGSNGAASSDSTAASDTAAAASGTASSASRLRYPQPLNGSNPHAQALKNAYGRALAAYTRLWQDYNRPRWDLYRYIVNLMTYTRVYNVYYASLTRYWKWEDENQTAFSGRVVFYPAGTAPPTTTDPLAATPAAASSFGSTSSVTDTGKGGGTATDDDWTKNAKDADGAPFTDETDVTSSAASATSGTSPTALTLDPSQPVADAKVEISLNINYIRDPGPGGYPRKETTTNAKGEFSLKGLQQGVWTYTVTAAGFATKTGTFEIQEGQVTRNIVLEKEAVSSSVSGHVYTIQARFLSESLQNIIRESDAIDASLLRQIESNLTGSGSRSFPLYLRPVRRQEVTITRTDPVIAIYPPPPVETDSTDTDESGAFTFSGLKGQSYRIDVERDGYKPYSLEIDTTQKTDDLRIILIEEDADLGDTPFIAE